MTDKTAYLMIGTVAVLSLLNTIMLSIMFVIFALQIATMDVCVHNCNVGDSTVCIEAEPAPSIETIIADKAVQKSDEPERTKTDAASPKPSNPSTKQRDISDADMRLLAILVYAEAGNQSEQGKRLVIDTVLNRLDHPSFPNTIQKVIYQKNQFSTMKNNYAVKKYSVHDDICDLIRDELKRRTNYHVGYFRTKHYSKYGKPLFKVGDHYFSSL